MTKIPIFLSMLSLVSGGAPALSMTNLGLEQTASTYAAGDTSVVANQNVAGLKFTRLSLAMRQLEWEFQYQDDEGRTFSRYVMTSLNFMNGVTEAEADQKLATLGNSEWENWTDWRTDYAAIDGRYTAGTSLSATLGQDNLLQSNQSDLIYYAVEYKNWDNPAVESIWYRGKLDYRSCAHSPDLEAHAMTCQISLDSATNQYVFTPSNGTLSYDEEMAQIARESYLDSVTQQVEGLEERKAKGDESYRGDINGVEYAFEMAQQQIEQMHIMESLAAEIADLEQRIDRLKQTELNPPSQPDDPATNDTNSSSNNQNQTSASPGGMTNSAVSNNGNADTKYAEAPMNGTAVIFSETTPGSIVSGNSNQEDVAVSEIDDRSNVDNFLPGVEVPNLGVEEPWLKRHLWVVLLPILIILLLILFLVKRRRDEEEEI